MIADSPYPVRLSPCQALPLAFARGQLVSLNPETVWRIESGFVRTTAYGEDGDVMTLGIWSCGDVVGQSLSCVPTYQIECLSKAKLSPLNSLDIPAAKALQHHRQQVEILLSIVRYKRIPDRLMSVLQWLNQRFGQETDSGWLLDLHLTHQILAETAGTTRVTVTRLLTQFEQEGRLQKLNHHRFLMPRQSL
jgi:CRP-like cAMP-binding protein